MEDSFRSLGIVEGRMDYVAQNGTPKEKKDLITPENIGYVSALCVLAFFGTLGNILILIMFSKKELCQTSYSVYIRCAAVSDTVFMLMNISEDVIDHVVSGYNTVMLLNISYNFGIFWSVTNGTFRAASPWIVVALSVDRCVAIWNPLNRTFYCTKRTGIIIAAAIVLISLGVELGLNLNLTWITIELSEYPEFPIIKQLVSETGLPCIIMLIPNVLVIYKIQQSLSFRRTFSTTDNESRKVAKSVRPLLVVSCLAFLTLLPISITEMVEVIKIHKEVPDHNENYGADIHDDYTSFPNRNESFGRMTNDRHITNDSLFNNMTSLGSLHKNDQRKNTSWGIDVDQYNRSSDLIENSDFEKDAHTSDGMNGEATDGMNENGSDENADENSDRFVQEIDDRHEDNEDKLEEEEEREEEEEGEEEDNDNQVVIDKIWKTCNFIYMCNFSQNFYLLVISSRRYRQILFQMFCCKQKKLSYSENNAQTKTTSSTDE